MRFFFIIIIDKHYIKPKILVNRSMVFVDLPKVNIGRHSQRWDLNLRVTRLTPYTSLTITPLTHMLRHPVLFSSTLIGVDFRAANYLWLSVAIFSVD